MDLREPKVADSQNIERGTTKPGKTKAKDSPKKKGSKDEEVIHWHSIRGLCNSYEMSFPNFFVLMMVLGSGEKKLGFCDCPSCNLGYREMLATIANVTEKKKLTAQSREIVIKARGEQIDGHKINFSELIGKDEEKKGDEQPQEKPESIPQRGNKRKITIELDTEVIENAVFNVLKSEKGQGLIRSTSRRRKKKNEQDSL